jgi:hypothetical protein
MRRRGPQKKMAPGGRIRIEKKGRRRRQNVARLIEGSGGVWVNTYVTDGDRRSEDFWM